MSGWVATTERYTAACADADSDIAVHLPVLAAAVAAYHQTGIVVELGVRDGNSTQALLQGVNRTGGHLWSVDRVDCGAVSDDPRWSFVRGRDTDPLLVSTLPADADVVFIDTDHAYAHTLTELEMWVPRVRPGGVVLLHDTMNESPGERGEAIGLQPPFPVLRAVEDYCAEHDLRWENDERGWGLGTVYV